MPAGYSQRSLVEKLGIKPHTRIAIVNAPRGYRNTLGKLPPGVTVATRRPRLTVVHSLLHRRSRTARGEAPRPPAGAIARRCPLGFVAEAVVRRGDRHHRRRGPRGGITDRTGGRESRRHRRRLVGAEAGAAARKPVIGFASQST